uniref:F-box protein At5g07610-like n=1 Tax=Fragaria vesca subsp. vesca TaxID=101020 RepID=UPI0005CA6CD6|nr:PREDICTED: F-box protein At5g07610-like [Fragaria vesca subsp. vesca]
MTGLLLANIGSRKIDSNVIRGGLFLCTTFYVLNPTTNQFSTIIIPAVAAAISGSPCILLGYALAFDPSKSPHYKVFFLQTITELHWIGLYNEIGYYHIDDESVRDVYYPPPHPPMKCEVTQLRMFGYFQESHCGSHLHLINIYVSHFTRFEVFEMGRDYSGWFLKYHVDLDPQLTGFPWLGWCRCTVLFLFPEEGEGEESSSDLL